MPDQAIISPDIRALIERGDVAEARRLMIRAGSGGVEAMKAIVAYRLERAAKIGSVKNAK